MIWCTYSLIIKGRYTSHLLRICHLAMEYELNLSVSNYVVLQDVMVFVRKYPEDIRVMIPIAY